MTTVHVDLRRPQRGTLDKAPVHGSVDVALYRRIVEDDAYVLEQQFTQVLVEGQASLELDPTDGTFCWIVHERVPTGITRYIAVPGQDAVEYVDCADVDPKTLTPTADALAAWEELGARILALPKVVSLTQAAYDALPTKDSTTMYLITTT